MDYHKKKYIVDCINHNYKYNFVDSKLKIYDLDNKEVEYKELLEYLNDEFELEFNESMELIIRWYQGDVYADHFELFTENSTTENI
jgi:hypothetical protein